LASGRHGIGIDLGSHRVRERPAESGTHVPEPATGGYASGLTPDVERRLRSLAAAAPGSTREQLRDAPSVSVDVRTVGRWLRELGSVRNKSHAGPLSRTGPT